MKKDAKASGNTAIFNLCENQLDVITLLEDDYHRINKAIDHKLFNVASADIRAFIDNLPDLERKDDV